MDAPPQFGGSAVDHDSPQTDDTDANSLKSILFFNILYPLCIILIITITLTFPVIMAKSDCNDEHNTQWIQNTILRQIVFFQYHPFVINEGTVHSWSLGCPGGPSTHLGLVRQDKVY